MASFPVRRWPGQFGDMERPIAMPHLRAENGGVSFLGERIDPELFSPDRWSLWLACDGSRPRSSWSAAENDLLGRWHAAGLIVAAPSLTIMESRSSTVVTVIAPHPDDAQLAVGGLLAATTAKVIDVFSMETWTRRSFYHSRLELAAELLLAEERLACQVLGTALLTLGYIAAESRPAWRDGFYVDPAGPEPANVEPRLLTAIMARLEPELRGPEVVLAPLGAGGHVDHVLVRAAVLGLVRAHALDPARLAFYEDMPYSAFTGHRPPQPPAGPDESRPVTVPLPQYASDVKREALWAYRLQVSEALADRVLRYGTKLAGDGGLAERLWIPAGSRVAELLGGGTAKNAANCP